MGHWDPRPWSPWTWDMISVMSLSVHKESHVTITHDEFNLIAQGPPLSGHGTLGPPAPGLGHLDMKHWDPLALTSGGQDWRPVQTCLLGEPAYS